MASKQLPVVGEAFLGSDPLVQKMIRVTFGSSGFSGSVDVELSTVGAQNLLTFADSNFRITNIFFNTIEVFSVGAIQVGVDSDPVAFAADTLNQAADFTALQLLDLQRALSTGLGSGGIVSTDNAVFAGAWPADSDDKIVVSFSGAATLGTEGACEMYVFYIEIPDQP